MTEVIDRLVSALNSHDLDAAAALFDADYRSSQPAHPGRAFTGRDAGQLGGYVRRDT